MFRIEEVEGRKIKRVKGGSLESLVEHLISDANDDPDFLNTITLCHTSFTTSSELLRLLLRKHEELMGEADHGDCSEASRRRHRRACSALAKSLADVWPAISDSEVREVIVLASDLVCLGYLDIASELRDKILSLQQAGSADSGSPAASPEEQRRAVLTSPLSAQHVQSRPLGVLDVHSLDIAREITAIDAELFHRITPSELLQWSKTQNRDKCPNIIAHINFATLLTRWGMAQICSCFDLKKRARIYHKLVEVMKCLKTLHNFDSLMALLAAFHSSSVSRMEQTKEASGAKAMSILEKIGALLSHEKSFCVYRAALAQCARPAVPYLGVYLTDLTFIQQGNPNTIPSLYNPDAKLINIAKVDDVLCACAVCVCVRACV